MTAVHCIGFMIAHVVAEFRVLGFIAESFAGMHQCMLSASLAVLLVGCCSSGLLSVQLPYVEGPAAVFLLRRFWG